MTRRVVVVGDALLDRDVVGSATRLAPDAPVPVLDEETRVTRPGGAALAALVAAGDGGPVTLITALADDPAARELAALLDDAGVEVIAAAVDGVTPEKIRLRAGTQSLLRLDRGSHPGVIGPLPWPAADALAEAGAVLVSDYGRGLTELPELRCLLAGLRRPVVWDPHPRGAVPVPGMAVVTPNLRELAGTHGPVGPGVGGLVDAARRAAAEWRAGAVAVTRGVDGVLLVSGDSAPLAVPVVRAAAGDPCGAGDRFAAAVAVALSDGAVLSEAVAHAAAAAAAWVATGAIAATGRVQPTVDPGAGAAGPAGHPGLQTGVLQGGRQPGVRPGGPHPSDGGSPIPDGWGPAVIRAREMRADGRILVVAGGCFDLLHAGHVAILEAARALGDGLIVALNSDDSVRRLKGEGRPVVPAQDRAAVLRALGAVDEVAVFDQDGPDELLGLLRPDIFAKGGDYAGARLPETDVLAAWGGQVVVLPYLAGRSTTGVLSQLTGR